MPGAAVHLGWYNPYLLSWHYEIPVEAVSVDNVPHDCEWWTAPIGAKNCHYEASLSGALAWADRGEVKISYDGWKTWEWVSRTTLAGESPDAWANRYNRERGRLFVTRHKVRD